MRHWCRKVSCDASLSFVDLLQDSSVSSNGNSSGTQHNRSVACSRKSVYWVIRTKTRNALRCVTWTDVSVWLNTVKLLLGKDLNLTVYVFYVRGSVTAVVILYFWRKGWVGACFSTCLLHRPLPVTEWPVKTPTVCLFSVQKLRIVIW